MSDLDYRPVIIWVKRGNNMNENLVEGMGTGDKLLFSR